MATRAEAPPAGPSASGDDKPLYRKYYGMWLFPAVGLVGVAVYGLAQESLSVLAVGFMTAAAAAAVGAFLGFLFSIPRTLTGEAPADATTDQRLDYRPNTNLEQISDWLTKILVGVGLVQLGEIRESMGDLATFLEPGFGGDDGARGFALLVAGFFVVTGFLVGYLFTRLLLQGAFAAADRGSLSKAIARLDQRVGSIETQAAADAAALGLITRQLEGEGAPIEQQQLDKAIAEASRAAKTLAFQRANQRRRDTWQTDTPSMERTIPIFRALVAADPRKQFHRHFAELGFALKDKDQPDYEGAYRALTEAMEIRDRRGDAGYWLMYEFNRAVCAINLARPAEEILADLEAAAEAPELAAIARADPTVKSWLAANGIDPRSFRAKRASVRSGADGG